MKEDEQTKKIKKKSTDIILDPITKIQKGKNHISKSQHLKSDL